MKYISVCSGIDAASVAWHDMGWEPVAFSEIEPFPSEVLKIRFPNTPNWGDMTKFNTWPDATINLLVGGTPCQSFSVAGLRQGLKDPRGNLMLTFLGIAQRYKPKWIVWENVPGVLSSNGGKDFGSFLGALGELGYGWAYRVLDAQWFGVAQRRRRVFVVGCLGDQRAAAEVLFESEGVSRNPAPSREKRQTAPASTEGGIGEGGKWLTIQGKDVSPTVTSKWKTGYGGPSGGVSEMQNMICSFNENTKNLSEPVPHAFKVRGGCEGGGKGYLGQDEQTVQDEQAFTISTHQDQNIAVPFRKVRRAQSTEDFETWQQDEVSNTINTFDVGDIRSTNVVAQPVIIDRAAFNQGENAQYEPKIEEGETMSSLVAKGPHAVAQLMILNDQGGSFINFHNDNLSPTLRSQTNGHEPCILNSIAVDTYNQTINEDTTQTIGSSASDVNHYGAVIQNVSPTITQCKGSRGGCSDEAISEIDAIQKAQSTMAIRRLTPVECEKLQGFPPNWTRIPWKKKPEEECPDGPRYKACGNSMAVPCMKWIGERINKVENKNFIEPLP